MAFTMNRGKKDILDRYIAGTEFRLMLVQTPPASGAAAADLNVVGDVAAAECTFTNYARKTITLTTSEDDTTDLARLLMAAAQTYTAAGGATNNTVAGCYVFRRGTNGADTSATDPLLAFLDLVDITTNGGDLNVSQNAAGILTLA